MSPKRTGMEMLAGWCPLFGWLPDEFWDHRRAARREKLLGWRSMLDAAVERLSDEPEQGKAGVNAHMSAFKSHRRAARREEILAMRSVVDEILHWMDEPRTTQQQATRVEVE